jgi:hypothetical protein
MTVAVNLIITVCSMQNDKGRCSGRLLFRLHTLGHKCDSSTVELYSRNEPIQIVIEGLEPFDYRFIQKIYYYKANVSAPSSWTGTSCVANCACTCARWNSNRQNM